MTITVTLYLIVYLQRNPEDYLARQKAQEEEERLEKSRYQRRYSDKRSDKDVSKRKSYIAPHTPDDEAQKAAREYRQKRRSLNLDRRAENSEKTKTDRPIVTDSGRKNTSSEKKSNEKPLKISTDSTDGFTPESASSPRSSGVTSPRSATSPPRPSTKRKAAPPPPVSTSTSSTPSVSTKDSSSTPVQQTTEEPILQPSSPQSKIPKPVTNQEPQNSTPNTPQNTSEQVISVQSESRLNTPQEIQQPSRPPRRKKKPGENKSFLHESFEKEQIRKSKEIALNVDLKDSPIEDSLETSKEPESKTGDIFIEPNSCDVKEDSLLDTIIKELPAFQAEKSGKESKIKQTTTTKDGVMPVNGTVEEVIVANVDPGIECEIKPVRVDKQRGRIVECKGVYKIELSDKQVEPDIIKADDSDEEKRYVINRQHQNTRKTSLESTEPDNFIEHIKPETYNKRSEDLLQTFERIAAYPNRNKFKDTKDTISIASDISVSSAGSEAPPLPESAPPPLPFPASSHLSPSLSEDSQREEVVEEIELEVSKQFETSPNMSEVPDVSEKENVREVVSPINDLKASMFSMRVTSPTRDMTGDKHTNGELTVDTSMGKDVENSDSDISDVEDVTGNFTPGMKDNMFLLCI